MKGLQSVEYHGKSLKVKFLDKMTSAMRARNLDFVVIIVEYWEQSMYWRNYSDSYHSCDIFRQELQAKHGHPPYMSLFMAKRW
jgi:hypothetical protein